MTERRCTGAFIQVLFKFMAFDALPGVRIVANQTQQTFIIGDFFAVFEEESPMPDVYRWSDVKIYSEDTEKFTIGFEGLEYIIPKNCFESGRQIIYFRAIAEGQLVSNKDVQIKFQSRILPPKNNYHLGDLPENNVFSGTGIYMEKEVNAGSISHVYGKFRGLIWSISLLAAIAVFICLWAFGGKIEANWLFYAVISLFACIGLGTFIYLLFCVVARHRYANFLKRDVSTTENIVFIVAPGGFAAIEQCVYSGKELIPWSNASYFYETKYSVAIVCKDKSVCCIPKRFFQKSSQNDLVQFVSGKVVQN